MKLVKINLAVSAIAFAVMAIFLIWNEDVVTCDITTCKVLETICICCSLILTKVVASINTDKP